MNKFWQKAILAAAMLAIIAGCAEENPDLVNPPSQSEMVYVRILNFGSDREPRALMMEQIKSTATTPFAASSPAIHPPQDSAFISIESGAGQDFQLTRRVKFVRNINYTFIALPSPRAIRENIPVDTIATLTTTTTIPENSRQAYLRVFNAFPDTNSTFTIREGCPNGRALASNVGYMRAGGVFNIRSGTAAVSLIKQTGSHQEIVGLYRMDLDPRGQYVLMPAPAADGTLEFLILDQNDLTVGALEKMIYIEERTTQIRPLNFSRAAIDVEKMPGEIVSLGQQPETIGDYATLTACDSEYADSIIVMSNSTTASIASASLEVLQRYTLIVADSAQKNAAQSILVEPPIIDRDPGARAMVRVVNAAWNREQLTVTLGARVDTAFANGYNSGYVVAEDLTYGAVSELKFLNPGLAPIAMFTSGTPSKLLSTGNYEFLSGLNYLLIITSDDQGRDRLTVVEDDEINRNAEYLGSGVFTQVINALPAKENIDISLPPLMDQSTIYYTGSIATVVPPGQHLFTANGMDLNFSADADKRNMIIVAGDADNTDIIYFSYDPIVAEKTLYKRRFINASKQVPSIAVKINDEESGYVVGNVPYKSKTSPMEIHQDAKVSLLFYNAATHELLTRVNDIKFTFGKNYSIIFAGDSTQGGFSAIVQQEF